MEEWIALHEEEKEPLPVAMLGKDSLEKFVDRVGKDSYKALATDVLHRGESLNSYYVRCTEGKIGPYGKGKRELRHSEQNCKLTSARK